jgi:hypothetical protein
MRRFPLAAALAALLSLAPYAAAQQPALEAGVRVRVLDPALGPLPRAGLVAGASGDTLAVYFRRGRAADTLLLSRLERVEISRGFGEPAYGRAGTRGAFAGLLAGVAVAAAFHLVEDPGGYGFGLTATVLGVPAMGAGMILGLVTARPEERWAPLRREGAAPP